MPRQWEADPDDRAKFEQYLRDRSRAKRAFDRQERRAANGGSSDVFIGIVAIAATAAIAGFGSSRAEAASIVPDPQKDIHHKVDTQFTPSKPAHLLVDLTPQRVLK
jgi:hypothetical protein